MDDESAALEVSVDPRNVRAELVQFFTTAMHYVLRQGFTIDDLHAIVDRGVQSQMPEDAYTVPDGYALVPIPELRNAGVRDMRGGA